MFNKIKEFIFGDYLHDELLEACVENDHPIVLRIKGDKRQFFLMGIDEAQVFLADGNEDHRLYRFPKDRVVHLGALRRRTIARQLREKKDDGVRDLVIGLAKEKGWCNVQVEDYDTNVRFKLEMDHGLTSWLGSSLLTIGEVKWIFSIEYRINYGIWGRIPVTEFRKVDGITI